MNKPELIIALQDAAKRQGGDLSRLDAGVEFEWDGYRYKICGDGRRYYLNASGCWRECIDEKNLIEMLQTASTIKILPPYTTAEAEQAKKDMGCSVKFKWVSKDEGTGLTMLWRSEPTEYPNGFILRENDPAKSWAPPDTYPSLKPGTKERLEVIAGCGE